MFKKIPFILLTLVAFAVLTEPFLPTSLLSIFYALSLTIKSLIISLLPIVVFALVCKTVSSLSKGAARLVLLVFGALCLSNFLSTWISFCFSHTLSHLTLSLPKASQSALTPAWTFTFPSFLRTDYTMLAAFLFGLFTPYGVKLSSHFEKLVNRLLACIVLLIPFFITGFLFKLLHEKVLQNILYDYAPIFLLIITAQVCYISLLYLIANRFSLRGFFTSIKNMFPAAVAGFGSMSSAAALPLTLIGSEKNTNNSPLTKLAIPTTVNIHLIGDCLAIPLFAIAIMKGFGLETPTPFTYLIFSFYFVLAKFSVAAIPGGGIIVMLPILEHVFNFTPEMSSLITAFYILFDPIITVANITGNGAFAMFLQFFKKYPIIKNS